MAPTRGPDSAHTAEASSKSKSKTKRNRPQHSNQEPDSNSASGVQKIKAALRQTRRLLAKDKLAADVRVETQRRQKALEAELQQAELSRKERSLALRYHKIKFFERQKVTRKLKQVKKAVESASSDSTKKQALSELYDLRVDLNYIFHYPKVKKYISLFPPEVRKAETPSSPSLALAESAKTNAERYAIKKWIREQMESGELPSEPEIGLAQKSKETKHSQRWPGETPSTQMNASKMEADEEDDFFGEDD